MIVGQATHVELITPYGGHLVDLLVRNPSDAVTLWELANTLPRLHLSPRSLCDLELLTVGGFSPLDRFMGEADYRRVLAESRLGNGTLFPIPITLPVTADEVPLRGAKVALCDSSNSPLAIMEIEEVYRWDLRAEAKAVIGTTSHLHPLLAEMHQWGTYFVSGPMNVLSLPSPGPFGELYLTPAQTRAHLARLGSAHVVSFQTRNPLHRAHEALVKHAMEQVHGSLLLHPSMGLTQPGDVDPVTRARCYVSAMRYLPVGRSLLSLLPLAMRMAGPREAVWHAIIRRNYGADHLIVGRSHASPQTHDSRPLYAPEEARQLVSSAEAETGVHPVPFDEFVYLPDAKRFEQRSAVPEGARVWALSGTAMRQEYLEQGRRLPSWFTRPQTAEILRQAYPPSWERGFCIWLAGLPCAGKSTIAEHLVWKFRERGREVTLLDGDAVRKDLSEGLGFSREDRIRNNERIAFVAREVVRHRGIAVCAAILPYEEARQRVRAMFGPGRFLLVYVDTSLELCERRDVKGMYARARRGEIRGFTGVDDPFDPPTDPEVLVKTDGKMPTECAAEILAWLTCGGYLEPLGSRHQVRRAREV